MLLDFISEFIIQFIVSIAISIFLVNYFSLNYKVLLVFFLVPFFTILLLFISNLSFSSKEFDSNTWKSNLHLREQMAKNIIKNEILIGKTKKEVLDILGKNFEKDDVNKDTIFYTINEQYFTSYLYVKLKKNKVVNVGIITD